MSEIIEKKLGIPGDYQYKAIRSNNFFQANWHNNKLVALGTVLNDTKAKTVLDLGTGSGNFEFKYAKRLKRIVGVDYNNEALKFLAAQARILKIKNIKLISSDLRRLKSSKIASKFDLVICVDVIEHLSIKDAEALVKKIRKLLNAGGYVCIITPNYKSPWILIEKFLDKFTLFPHMSGKQHLAKFYEGNLNRIFTKNSYEVISSTSFNLFSFIFPYQKLSEALCKLEILLGLPFGNLVMGLYKIQTST